MNVNSNEHVVPLSRVFAPDYLVSHTVNAPASPKALMLLSNHGLDAFRTLNKYINREVLIAVANQEHYEPVVFLLDFIFCVVD